MLVPSAVFLQVLLLWLLPTTESLLFQPTARPCSISFDRRTSTAFNTQANDDTHDTAFVFGKDATTATIQQRLVEFGLAWNQSSVSSITSNIPHNMQRVPGCVATVYILATTTILDDGKKTVVRLQGYSDAIVSRGLLAVLSRFLSTLDVSTVLDLNPSDISSQLGLQSALTKGRNDGLANMLKIVQEQLLREQQETDNGKAGTIQNSTTESTDDVIDAPRKPTVALLLSGGVDSSVALRLLQQDGYDVTAFYLKIWLEDELAHLGTCPWEEDVDMCQQVCDQANVELEIISLQEEYHQRVMQHTLQEASMGRTPNPDILCNSRVKFGCFLEYLDENYHLHSNTKLPFDFIASGHYAQLQRSDNNDSEIVRLFRAPDPVKDQSYFLCALKQSQLQKLLFPIGHLEKPQVRELANAFELPNRFRPDSQGLCFLGKVKFRDFLSSHLGMSPGDIIDAVTGERIGVHDGVWYHTVGQRKGIGKSLDPLAVAKGPWYVVAKDPSRQVVYASNQYEEQAFEQARSEFHVENIHWISGSTPSSSSSDYWMKIRHGPRIVKGRLELIPKGVGNNENDVDDEGIIKLEQKDGGLAPGQYVVFYNDEAECLGGGIISERHWAKFLLDKKSRVLEEEEEDDNSKEEPVSMASTSS